MDDRFPMARVALDHETNEWVVTCDACGSVGRARGHSVEADRLIDQHRHEKHDAPRDEG